MSVSLENHIKASANPPFAQNPENPPSSQTDSAVGGIALPAIKSSNTSAEVSLDGTRCVEKITADTLEEQAINSEIHFIVEFVSALKEKYSKDALASLGQPQESQTLASLEKDIEPIKNSDWESSEKLKAIKSAFNDHLNTDKDKDGIKNIDALDLSNRGIEVISDVLSIFKKMRYLNLAKNRIKILPNFLDQLKKLNWLFVSNNQIEFLPDSLRTLSGLSLLWLQNNSLTKLPEWLGELNSLSSLRLDNNDIAELPSLEGIRNLKELNISNTKVSKRPDKEPLGSLIYENTPLALAERSYYST